MKAFIMYVAPSLLPCVSHVAPS